MNRDIDNEFENNVPEEELSRMEEIVKEKGKVERKKSIERRGSINLKNLRR